MTDLPALAAAPLPSPGLAPRSVRIKDLLFPNGPVLRTSTGARPARSERRCQTADAVSYLTSEIRPVMERQPGRDRQVCASGTSAGRPGPECWPARM